MPGQRTAAGGHANCAADLAQLGAEWLNLPFAAMPALTAAPQVFAACSARRPARGGAPARVPAQRIRIPAGLGGSFVCRSSSLGSVSSLFEKRDTNGSSAGGAAKADEALAPIPEVPLESDVRARCSPMPPAVRIKLSFNACSAALLRRPGSGRWILGTSFGSPYLPMTRAAALPRIRPRGADGMASPPRCPHASSWAWTTPCSVTN